MKSISIQVKNRIKLIALTALAICLCCVFAACTKAQAESSDKPAVSVLELAQNSIGFADSPTESDAAEANYSRWLSNNYSAKVYTRGQWLTDLEQLLNLSIPAEETASYTALTRDYVARTLYDALGYEPRTADSAKDLTASDTALSTLVYYGYFLPDDSGNVYPNAPITENEYQSLLTEVDRYTKLCGKRVLSFGDSIMFGMGNNERGISDMTAEKYGMTVLDYSISGATFGVCKGHSHIPDQIKAAARLKMQADIILLNGGTNDMVFVTHGAIAEGYDTKNMNQKTFAGGFEYSAYLLQKYWKNIPVVYIRAHDMDLGDDTKEQQYGDTELTIAQKWSLYIVDIYNDTDFCTEQVAMREAYTLYKEKYDHCDGVHPTALGYAKYYLPLVSDKVTELLSQ